MAGSRRFLAFLFERALCLIDDRLERGGIRNGEFRENFSIEANACSFQSFRKAAVRHPVCTRSGVQALNPEITKRAFTCLAVAIGPILTLHDRVFGVAEKF